MRFNFAHLCIWCTVCANHLASGETSEMENIHLQSNDTSASYGMMTVKGIMEEVLTLKNVAMKNEEANIRLQSELNRLTIQNQKEINQLKAQNEKLAKQVLDNENDTREKLQNLMLEIMELKTAQNSFVAFTAFTTETHNYNAGDRIQFDSALTNYGGYYSTITNIFTCPVTAYYWFAFHIYTREDFIHANIRVNGAYMVAVDSSNQFDSASNSVITLCEEGQQVDVVCTGDGAQLWGSSDSNKRRSTFSGVLMRV